MVMGRGAANVTVTVAINRRWQVPLAGDFVRLSATAAAIVDTPIFQRLRHLKQLGMTGDCCNSAFLRSAPPDALTCPLPLILACLLACWCAEYVYPTATHTRFVHSLGVAHRAKVPPAAWPCCLVLLARSSTVACRGSCVIE
jgi:hypothetical protein